MDRLWLHESHGQYAETVVVAGGGRILEDLVLVHDLDSMLIFFVRGVLAHGGEMGVHHEGRRGGVLDIARTTTIDLVRFGHI